MNKDRVPSIAKVVWEWYNICRVCTHIYESVMKPDPIYIFEALRQFLKTCQNMFQSLGASSYKAPSTGTGCMYASKN